MQKIPTSLIVLSGLLLIALSICVYWYFWMKTPPAPTPPPVDLVQQPLADEQFPELTVEQKTEILESLKGVATSELSEEEKSTIFDSLTTTSNSEPELSEEEKMNILKSLGN